ncbi:MAG TPA: metalloregulator ArsR/SmtB family transcription factor [Actinophytocola sp.]|uniref:ArsR/SmtB family transcription factor n=1 Tax=Actinophytocola sp. TaxID=1872138 RepID=UPI002F920224
MTKVDPVLRALGHPTRLRMLTMMWSGPMSAAGLAAELGISHGLASQHLRTLHRAGLVVLDEVRPKRGGRERLYRAVKGTPLSDQKDAQPLLVEAMISNLRYRLTAWRPGETGAVTEGDLWLTPRQWADARTRLLELSAEMHEQARPPHTPGTVQVSVTLLAFEMLGRGPEGPAAH